MTRQRSALDLDLLPLGFRRLRQFDGQNSVGELSRDLLLVNLARQRDRPREVGLTALHAGWYVKMSPDGFGGEELHLASGQETGRFVIAMPQTVLESQKDGWAVQMLATGPQNSQVRFRNVQFVDEMPDGIDSVLAVP